MTPQSAFLPGMVVYQIYPRSFKDASGDGVGDLPGITEHLDYIQALGADAIWIGPFYPSPMVDFGYDVSDYQNVDPLFGTLADFDRLVSEAHRRKIRVVIDLVANHTSDQHPWFKEAQSSKDNPKRNWYIWHDGKSDSTPPNNWLSVFGGSAWEYDPQTGQYYLHSFAKQQPDLNWENPALRQEIYKMMRFWLDKGIDGFRLDAIAFCSKDTLWPPLPAEYNGQWAMYYASGPHLHDYMQEMNREVNTIGSKANDALISREVVTLKAELEKIDELLKQIEEAMKTAHENLDGLLKQLKYQK